MDQLIRWQQEEFLPWQSEMRKMTTERDEIKQSIQSHKEEIKYMLAMIMDGKEKSAVRLWNQLGMKPMLSDIAFSSNLGMMTLEEVTGNKYQLELEKFLDTLKKIIAG